MFQRKIGLAATLAGATAIALLTLLPHPGQEELVRATPATCLVCGELGGVDVILNVLLFIPFGLGLGLLGVPWPMVAAAGLATSCAVEFLQMEVIPGRDASLSDLITNTTGALLGGLIARGWRRLAFPAHRTSTGLAAGWATSWFALALATGAGLQPAPTTSANWYGQWAPELGHLDVFRGEVLDARSGDAPLPPGRRDDTALWRHRLARDTFRLSAEARLGPPTARLAPIVSVFDGRQVEILLLGQWGRDAVYRVRMAPTRLRLRNPAVRLPGGLDLPEGTPVRIEGGTAGPRFKLQAEGPEGARALELPFSPQWTWALLLPYDYALGPGSVGLTALWLLGLLLPLGWWAARGGPAALGLAVGAVVLGVGGTRFVLGFDPAPLLEWLGAAGGAGLGALLSRAARRVE